MERLVKILNNGLSVVFDRGKFDDWCVYLVQKNGTRYAPKDVEYFANLQEIAKTYPANKIFNNFLSIYQNTTNQIDPKVIELIGSITKTYRVEHTNIIDQWFTVLYAGMVAEENKSLAVLKKRIKLLGMHQVLVEQIAPAQAAIFSKGKTWQEIESVLLLKGL
jgi:hypothetical protein